MSSDLASPSTGTAFVTVDTVNLDVVDARRSLAWWRDVAGLQVLAADGEVVELGVEGVPLIMLRQAATSPVRRGYSGLYHLAIHLPDEPALARVLARLVATRERFSPTDHLVAKSLYVSDPDGIGVEITVETPERVRSVSWPETATEPEIIDAEGRPRSGLEPLDLEALLAQLPDTDLSQSLPAGTRVGHVHLSVGDFAAAYAFYRDGIGMLQNNYAPLVGFGDLAGGGRLTHVVALNSWQGAGIPPRPRGMAGMDHFTLRFESPERLHDVERRVGDIEQRDGISLVRDPSGNTIALESPDLVDPRSTVRS